MLRAVVDLVQETGRCNRGNSGSGSGWRTVDNNRDLVKGG